MYVCQFCGYRYIFPFYYLDTIHNSVENGGLDSKPMILHQNQEQRVFFRKRKIHGYYKIIITYLY